MMAGVTAPFDGKRGIGSVGLFEQCFRVNHVIVRGGCNIKSGWGSRLMQGKGQDTQRAEIIRTALP